MEILESSDTNYIMNGPIVRKCGERELDRYIDKSMKMNFKFFSHFLCFGGLVDSYLSEGFKAHWKSLWFSGLLLSEGFKAHWESLWFGGFLP